jgi:NAD(P)-dependent dehydrogenase (short-subunit alcohol dehydrogenase family)
VIRGDIGDPSTAREIASTAMKTFDSIDGVINLAGFFVSKRFTEYTAQDFEKLAGMMLRTYICITQLAVEQMFTKNGGGSVTCATNAMAEHPIAGIHASLPMITKGGLEAITRNLAMECVKEGIRLNAVAPGVVDTPMYAFGRVSAESISPMGEVSEIADIVDAIVHLTEARHVTGEVLHVDAGAHNGKR